MEFNFKDVQEVIAATIPEREMLVAGDRHFTYGEMVERSSRLANYLLSRGLRLRRERTELAGYESGQDHVGLYLFNCPEYIDGLFACFQARLVSVNINFRYVEEELFYLLKDSGARAVVYHAEFAPRIAAIRDHLPNLEVLIQVADTSLNDLLPGAVDYDEALESSSADAPEVTPSPDDLYVLYTGGTTGMPKGVLWRSHDVFMAAMGGRIPGEPAVQGYEELAARVRSGGSMRVMCGPPLMHAVGQWTTAASFALGNTVVFPCNVRKFDPADVLQTMERECITTLLIVGDAFAGPIIEQMNHSQYDLSKINLVVSSGAPLSPSNKEALLRRFPGAVVSDGIGSSETGSMGMHLTTSDGSTGSGKFNPLSGTVVVSEDLERILPTNSSEIGWLGMGGNVPLGYLNDPEKTSRTFPVIGGVRYSVPGDRAQYRDDGSIEVLGRDSLTINSGGEKIFVEEVERALAGHPDVLNAVVSSRPSELWGEEVVAIVHLREGAQKDEEALLAEAVKFIARYKLPKAFVFVEEIKLKPSGKPDYTWARQQAAIS